MSLVASMVEAEGGQGRQGWRVGGEKREEGGGRDGVEEAGGRRDDGVMQEGSKKARRGRREEGGMTW